MEKLRYEYKFAMDHDPQKFIQKLNELGENGWQVVSYSEDGKLMKALLASSSPISGK